MHYILGDLAKPHFGLKKKEWHFLEKTIDAIYHNGALVNHLYDYQMLKPTNVDSTIELLKLATTEKSKVIHYISTLSAANQSNDVFLESAPANTPLTDVGYVLTKWVCEKILLAAAEQGVKVAIYRPGNITGHSRTGVTNYENNHALLFLKSCVQFGVAPSWDTHVEMTPVDILSDSIVKLSTQYIEHSEIYNLGNLNQISYQDYFKTVNQAGIPLQIISTDNWKKDYLKNITEDNALYALKDFYLTDSEDMENGPKFYFEANKTQQKLVSLGVNYLDDYASQIEIYLEYLKEQKFL